MKNKEKYFDKILEIFSTDEDITEKNCDFRNKALGKQCEDMNCDYCAKEFKKWLEQEYIELITLTEDEKVILKNVDNDFKWMAKDKDGWLLFSKVKPIYDDGCLCVNGYLRDLNNVIMFSHLFQFIKWEDEKPYNIDELLKQNGVER